MGIAALVIGIIAAILAFVPLCGMIAFVPAVVGLILGIVDVVLKGKKEIPKGVGIAGIVLNAIAIVIIFVWTTLFAAAATGAATGLEELGSEMNKAAAEMEALAEAAAEAAADEAAVEEAE